MTAPGSPLLDQIATLRLVYRSDYQKQVYFEVTRDSGPIPSTLDVANTNGLFAEGLDASGSLIAVGKQVPCEVNPDDPTSTIYLAPPFSILPAPAHLSAPRSGMGLKRFGDDLGHERGVLFVGGQNIDGSLSPTLDLYDPCRHVVRTSSLPFSRTGITVFVKYTWTGLVDKWLPRVFLFGGSDVAGSPTGSLLEFDSRKTAPFGDIVDYGDTGFPRSNEREVNSRISGAMPLQLNPPTGANIALATDVGPFPNTAIELSFDDGFSSGIAFLQGDTLQFERPAKTVALPTGRARASLVAANGPLIIVLGGIDTSAIFIRGDNDTILNTQPDVLRTPRFEPTLAVSGPGRVLVIGGVDANGIPIATAEVFSVNLVTDGPLAGNLTYITTIPIVPRLHPAAIPLTDIHGRTDYVVIAGGDEPTDTIELFTPPNGF